MPRAEYLKKSDPENYHGPEFRVIMVTYIITAALTIGTITTVLNHQKNTSNKAPILQENLQSGHYIRLSDNSVWAIHPSDTLITQSWITPTEIIVQPSGQTDYPYTLTNSLTGSSVRAKSVAQVPLPASKTPPVHKQPEE